MGRMCLLAAGTIGDIVGDPVARSQPRYRHPAVSRRCYPRRASQRGGGAMKLYMHPVSTTCRPVMQFIAESGIDCEMQVVDILKGEQYGEAYSKINPNHLVPLLVDGDFQLSESATILRYLAEKANSPAYP